MLRVKNTLINDSFQCLYNMPENNIVCHFHDEQNQHIGTGVGDTAEEAMTRSIKSGLQAKKAVSRGSVGCDTKESIAHDKASIIHNESDINGS